MIRYLNQIAWECGKGWYPLITELIEKLNPLCEDFDDIKVVQIKEKWGGLCFYINYGTKEIYDMIDIYESMSYKICDTCGKEGKFRGDLSWKRTLCDDCYQLKKDGKL
jgi:hypothetical protein